MTSYNELEKHVYGITSILIERIDELTEEEQYELETLFYSMCQITNKVGVRLEDTNTKDTCNQNDFI